MGRSIKAPRRFSDDPLNIHAALFVIPVWHLAALFGLAARVGRRDIFWIAWMLSLGLLPREGSWFLAAPVALLAGEAVENILLSAFAKTFSYQLGARIAARTILLAAVTFFAVVGLPLGSI